MKMQQTVHVPAGPWRLTALKVSVRAASSVACVACSAPLSFPPILVPLTVEEERSGPVTFRLCLAMAGVGSRTCSDRAAPVKHWRLPARRLQSGAWTMHPQHAERGVIDHTESSTKKACRHWTSTQQTMYALLPYWLPG